MVADMTTRLRRRWTAMWPNVGPDSLPGFLLRTIDPQSGRRMMYQFHYADRFHQSIDFLVSIYFFFCHSLFLSFSFSSSLFFLPFVSLFLFLFLFLFFFLLFFFSFLFFYSLFLILIFLILSFLLLSFLLLSHLLLSFYFSLCSSPHVCNPLHQTKTEGKGGDQLDIDFFPRHRILHNQPDTWWRGDWPSILPIAVLS